MSQHPRQHLTVTPASETKIAIATGILRAYSGHTQSIPKATIKRHQRDIKVTSWRKCATPPLRGVRRGGVAGVHISKKPRLFTNVNDRGEGCGRGLLMWCLTNVKTYWIFTFVCTTGDNGAPAHIPPIEANKIQLPEYVQVRRGLRGVLLPN